MSSEGTRDAWWRDALCAQVGPDLFFVRTGESVEEAKATCALCPVRQQCLTDALKSGAQYGVFGGFSRTQRAILSGAIEAGRDPNEVAYAAIYRDRNRRTEWTS